MFVEHKEAVEVTEAPARTLKLSEAIRIGARIRPQCFGWLFSEGRSCALGAALEAIGVAPFYAEDGICNPEYGDLYDIAYERFGRAMCDRVHVRNDEGRTREQIADELEAQGY